MNTLIGVLGYALPGILVALAVTFGVVTSFRSQRKWVISAIWIAITLLAAWLSRLGLRAG